MKGLFFYNIGDKFCYNYNTMIDKMLWEGVSEKTIHKAERIIGGTSFFCKYHWEAGDRGNCSDCSSWNPRNGKSGICKHWGYTYESGKEILIDLKDTLKGIKRTKKGTFTSTVKGSRTETIDSDTISNQNGTKKKPFW